MLAVLVLAFALFAHAETAQEANNGGNQPSSYSEQFVSAQYVPNPPKMPGWVYCSCVEFAKWYLGRQGEKWGAAFKMVPNAQNGVVGGLVLTNEGFGHVGVIIAIRGDFLLIVEGNYRPCERTEREININNPLIRGFRNP